VYSGHFYWLVMTRNMRSFKVFAKSVKFETCCGPHPESDSENLTKQGSNCKVTTMR
jgi:hypothetical protein